MITTLLLPIDIHRTKEGQNREQKGYKIDADLRVVSYKIDYRLQPIDCGLHNEHRGPRRMRSEQTCARDHDPCDDGGETEEKQQIVQDADGHRSPPLAASCYP
jgi:hypothetical protein